MLDPGRFEIALDRYETALKAFKPDAAKLSGELSDKLSDTQTLELLRARDALQRLWDEADKPPNHLDAIHHDWLIKLAQLDTQLKHHQGEIATHANIDVWRGSFNPPKSAWWWHFELPVDVHDREPPVDPRDRIDWLWNALTVVALTANLALVTDIASRFLTGAPGIWSSFAAITPGVLTLFASGGALTKVGQQTLEKMLVHIGLSKHCWHEAKFGLSAGLLGLLIGFHSAFPKIAVFYNQHGEEQYYTQGKLSSAQASFLRALQLNSDYPVAQYNLGMIYEDIQEFDQAQAEYQKAAQAGYPPAYKGLARLYILQGDADKAAPLLSEALDLLQKADKQESIDPKLAYALHKNLGWARLEQGGHPDAIAYLEAAIDLKGDRADAYCLLAQVREQQAQLSNGLGLWESCLKYARLQDDVWKNMARQRLDPDEEFSEYPE